MNYKEEIQKILLSLKKKGFDRRAIEREMGYKENSIDQILSKGGNKTFLRNIEKFNIEKSNTIEGKAVVGDELNRLIELSIKHEATLDVLRLSVEGILADLKGKSLALVSGELQQAIKMRADKLYDEFSKKR